MNLNRNPFTGNGTFRQSLLGAGGFAATKHFFTANTNPSRVYDPLRTYDFFTDRRPIPYDTFAVASIVQPHMAKESMAASEVQSVINRLQTVIKANEAFRKEVDDYYGMRVSRTSGGKRDRLRAERAALKAEADAANKMAAAAVSDLRSMPIAEVKATLKTDPDFVVTEADPASGGVLYKYAAPTAPAAAGPGGGMGWLLPVGAGLAAFFMLKG